MHLASAQCVSVLLYCFLRLLINYIMDEASNTRSGFNPIIVFSNHGFQEHLEINRPTHKWNNPRSEDSIPMVTDDRRDKPSFYLHKCTDDFLLLVGSSHLYTALEESAHITNWAQNYNLKRNASKTRKMLVSKRGLKSDTNMEEAN